VTNQRLGNITNFDSARVENVTRRYRLLDSARELLPDFRVAKCLHVPIPGQQIELWQDDKTGKAHLHGVGRCGSAWVCPVCSAKISIGRAAEIEEAVTNANGQGKTVVFVTLTASHKRADRLDDNLKGTKAAIRFMRKSRAWGRLRDVFGLAGQIDALEITWGFSAGWHVHSHAAFFMAHPPDVETIEDKIFTQWQNALSKQGMTCDRAHGVKVLIGTENLPGYLSKWGLKTELTSREKPGREESYSPFQLLALYEGGEGWAGRLFQEYADATKGVSSLRWSRGLRAELGMTGELTDQELAEAENSEGSTKLTELSRDEFKRLIYAGRRGVIGEMLMVAERGRAELLLWLSMFGISPPDT